MTETNEHKPFSLLQRKVEKINPERAASLLAFNNHEAQRRLSQRHVDYLARKIEGGLFRVGNVALGHCGPQQRLMNGQHTLSAVIKTGATVDALVEHYQVEGEKGFALLFQQFDPIMSSRTQRDMNRIEAAALGLEWPAHVVGLVVSGLSLNSGRYRNSTSEDRVALLGDNMEAGGFVARLLEGRARHLEKKAVVAAMLRTWNASHECAELFWTAVRDGEGLSRTMPEYHLRDFLMVHDTREGSRRRGTATDHEYLCRCISAWNARRAGASMKVLRYAPDKDVPRTA